jgi:hypothetical protein
MVSLIMPANLTVKTGVGKSENGQIADSDTVLAAIFQ